MQLSKSRGITDVHNELKDFFGDCYYNVFISVPKEIFKINYILKNITFFSLVLSTMSVKFCIFNYLIFPNNAL